MKWRSFLLIGACLAQAGCATAPPAGAAGFRVAGNVPDAAVYIDDVYVGRVGEWSERGRFIRPGAHRVELRHPSYYPRFEDIVAADRAETVVPGELHPLLPD